MNATQTKYLLIADGGSSKVEWCLVSSDGDIKAEFVTDGMNPVMTSPEDMIRYFTDVRSRINPGMLPAEIFYYGAGCATHQICTKTADALMKAWNAEKVEVESDMLAACRSLFGRRSGIACILGTGSNSALYNGESIIANTPPLGYVLGDEGSGTALGKRLLGDIFKRLAPTGICEAFQQEYGLTMGDVLQLTYREPAPNKFLASFTPFMLKHRENPYIRDIILDSFSAFFRRNIMQYNLDPTQCRIGCIGSIASLFEKELREVASTFGFQISEIKQRPMPGLVKHHISNE